jgi:hypothetical protein
MRGFAGAIGPWLVLQLYWTGWAALLLVTAALFWVRGREGHAATRLRAARGRLTRRAAGAAALAAALVLATGGFAFYNTNVLHEYRTARERTAAGAEYERRYGRFERVAQPRVAGVSLRAELYPARHAAELRASYRLVHDGATPVESLHVTTHPAVATGPLTLDRPATLALSDDRHGYRILALREPLMPGDTVRLDFTVRVGRAGFASDGVDDLVAANGTYLRNGMLPRIGYQPDRELSDLGDRRAQGLSPQPRIPLLDDPTARHAVGRAGAEQIAFEATIGTEARQRAVAPGALRRTWVDGRGRRYFHYAAERPIRNDFALFSAEYAVRAARWQPAGSGPERAVDIEVLHHPGHAWNVDGMVAGARAALEHLSAELGPYPHRQLRLVEHAGRSPTLHAYPINVSYQEGFALMDPSRDARGLDFPAGIVAHELAHQWWGGSLTPARAEGAALLTESLAWYSAMGVVEHARGPEELERLVALMREAWLPPRAPSDPPLLRASGWFLGYRKGPLAMYALREYVGAAPVNVALRRLLAAHPAGRPPLPTTRDLYRELEAVTPDSLRPVLHDLFAANTLWELATDSARAEPAPSGMTRVTLDVRARKLVVDTTGASREVPMHDLVEIGAFADGPGGGRGPAVYRRLHRIRSGTQRIALVVPARARWAGVDARALLFDLTPGNNVARLPGND